MQHKLYPITLGDIDLVWKYTMPLLSEVIKYADGKYHLNDLYQSLKNAEMQLWVAKRQNVDAICITQIINYPRKRVLSLLMVSGKGIEDWDHFREDIFKWAKEKGCESVELSGRPGWERFLKEDGFSKKHISLSKEL